MCHGSFCFQDTATTEIYTYLHTLSLHDALPISAGCTTCERPGTRWSCRRCMKAPCGTTWSGRRYPWSTARRPGPRRSEEHTSELQSLMRISYAVFCLKKKKLASQ